MSDSIFTVGEAFTLSLAPIPANSVLPADPIVWAVDNAELASLNTEAVPAVLTLLAPGTVNVTGTDGAIVATLAVVIQAPAATGATIVLTPVPTAPAA
jgi:hypothetical protein